MKNDYKYKKISVLELFGSNGIKKGLSKYTNTYIQKHNGVILCIHQKQLTMELLVISIVLILIQNVSLGQLMVCTQGQFF